jgi:hypothetical protein
VPQLQALYDQHFGSGAQQAAVPSPEEQAFQSWFAQTNGMTEEQAKKEFAKMGPQGVANWSPGGFQYEKYGPGTQSEPPQHHKDHAQILDSYGEPSEEFKQWFAQDNHHQWGAQPDHDQQLLKMLADPENKWTQQKVQGYLKSQQYTDPVFQQWYGDQINADEGAWDDESPTAKANLFNQFQNEDPDLKKHYEDVVAQQQDQELGSPDEDHIQAIQDLLQPVHQQQAPPLDTNALAEAIHAINPNFILDKLKSFPPKDLKTLLESQANSFKGTPKGDQYQQLLKEHFGGGQQQVPTGGQQPFNAQQFAQHMGEISGIDPELIHDNGIKLKDMTPEQAHQHLQSVLADQENPDSGWSEEEKQDYQDAYDKWFGGEGGQAPKAPKDLQALTNFFAQAVGVSALTAQGSALAIWNATNGDPAKLAEYLQNKFPAAMKKWQQWQHTDQPAAGSAKGHGAQERPSGPAPFDPHAIAKEVQAADPSTFDDKWAASTAEGSTPEQWKSWLKSWIQADYSPEETAQYQKVYDKYFGNGAQQQQTPGFSSEIANTSQSTLGSEVPMPLLEGGYDAKAPYQWAAGVQAWLAEQGITKPEDVTYGKLEQLYSDWHQMDDADKQQYIDKENGTSGASQSPVTGGIDINTTKPDKAGLEKFFDTLWPTLQGNKKEWVNHLLKPDTPWNADYFKKSYPEEWAKAEQLLGGGAQQGAGTPGGAETANPLTLADWNKIQPGWTGWFHDMLEGKSPAEQQAVLQEFATESHPKLAPAAQKALDTFFGGAQQDPYDSGPSQPVKPDFDWAKFGPEFKALKPGSSWATGPAATPEEAQAKLHGVLQQAEADYPGTEQTTALQQLYQKWFGGANPDLDAIHQEMESVEPEQPAKPFKSESLNPEDLDHWAAHKPQSAAEWKSFATWWGNTQLPPETEAGLYHQWFGKQATPEQAQGWFQQVFEHNSAPSNADLGTEGTPGWAHNSWAFGKNAETEWPVFKAWATQHPGIPKNTTLQQKLAIWNGLSTADKAEIAENYAPAHPVDTKAVLTALKGAFPDSDFAKWAKMSQGTLKSSVESLAKAGYAPAIPIFNQYFGGELPMPTEQPEDHAQPASQSPELPPLESLPGWVQAQLQDKSPGTVARLTKDYLSLARFAESVGQGDLVGGDTKTTELNKLGKMWQNLPSHLRAQIDQMDHPPWHSLEEFEQWKQAQPTVADAIKEAIPGIALGHFPWGYNNGYEANKQAALGKLIDQESQPEVKQKLLGIYHQFYGHDKTTLAEGLQQVLPDQDWNKLLQTKSKTQIASLLKKQLKTETDPVKWTQLAHLWAKHFPHPEKTQDIAPTGIKSLNDFFKYYSPGKLEANQLVRLKKYKESNPGNESSYIMHVYGEEANDPVAQQLAAHDDGKSFLPFHGWTPPSGTSMSSVKMDPAFYGKSDKTTTYTAPEETKSQNYQSLLTKAEGLKHLYSDQDRQTLKSDGFRHWFDKAPAAYRSSREDNPGVALDEYEGFMSGGQMYPGVPQGATKGKPKYYDMSPFALTPKPTKAIPKAFTHNPPRGDFVKFPQQQDTQETLPLGPGQKWAPGYEPLPIYRILNLDLDHKIDPSRAPAHIKAQGPKAVGLWTQQQGARLRRIDHILNGDAAQHDPQQELQKFKSWGAQRGLSTQEITDLANVMFGQQGDLFADDKWQHIKGLADKHPDIDMSELHDLAAKLDVLPPSGSKGNYDHPELGQLILDYLENTAHRNGEVDAKSQGGLGWHWTRAINKMYKGVPDASLGKAKMKATNRNVPIALSGLWAGQGEGEGHGSAFDPDHPGELEHNLLSHAPVHLRRVQIRAPGTENQGYGSWHDVIDHGPISLWGQGRYEEGDEKHRSDYAPDPMVKFKPSLAEEVTKATGTAQSKELDALQPGHQADLVFSQLIHDHPQHKEQLLKLYRDFFVGRPDLPTKPHTRRASLQRHAAHPHDLDPRNPVHLAALAESWGITNPERYGLPLPGPVQHHALSDPLIYRDPVTWARAEVDANGLEHVPGDQFFAAKLSQRQIQSKIEVRRPRGVLTYAERRL